nr:50S ribosomal protein L11 methyltransferase [Desulfuromonas sp.]
MRIQVPAAGVDLVCHELAELGCDGVCVEERKLDTFVAPDPDEMPAGDLVIKAYFPEGEGLEPLRRQVLDRLTWLANLVPGLTPALPEVSRVAQEDWAEGWKQHFSAVRIGRRLVVKPSWEAFSPAPGDVVVTLDPGMAFGTGTHGTTRLCLEALDRLFDGAPAPQRILDVGTGSGILAIAAAALGAGRVLACDIEEAAVQCARENALRNRVEDRVEVTGEPLEALEGSFHAVIANILAEENIRLAPELIRRLAPGGTLILSGILVEKEPEVIEAFSRYGLSGPEVHRQQEWSCILYRQEG